MANRLYSDLQDSAGRRYYFGLDSSPGICQPGVTTLTLQSLGITYPGIAFRTPQTITLSINGREVGPSATILSPGCANLSAANSAVGLHTELTIRLTLAPPLENPPEPFTPTILFINTITPAPALVSVSGNNHSLSEGGNIGFLRPPPADLTLFGYQYIRSITPPPDTGEEIDGQVAALTFEGKEPSLLLELIITPEVGALTQRGGEVIADRGFIWVDDDPAPPLTWT